MLTMLPTVHQFEFWLSTLLCSGIGAYIGAYLKKKGENIATHEDIEKLVDQVRATTEATKAIEARISNEVWDRQKQWELKRDTVVSVVQKLDAAKDALMSYAAKRDSVKQANVDPNRFELVMEAAILWNQRIADFDSQRALTALICTRELNDSLWHAQQTLRRSFLALSTGKASTYHDVGAEIRDQIIHAIAIARGELGLQGSVPTPQSSESLTAPSPAP